MKHIMVYNVAASATGALSVLEQYYKKCCNDKYNKYYFIVSVPKLINTDNVQVFNFPWVKKSWLHRLYFDVFVAHRLVEKYNVDRVLSLQELLIPFCEVPQDTFIQNCLAFVEYKFGIVDNTVLWIYQNILGKIMKKQVKKASKVIVQTKWMREVCSKQCKIDLDKIIIEPPSLDLKSLPHYRNSLISRSTFFFPATALPYKNHMIVLRACKQLNDEGIKNYHVVFTIKGNENKYAKEIKAYINRYDLSVSLVGILPREKVYDYYTKTTLIFPSFIETVGLPLLEARYIGTPIIVSNTVFAREILQDYSNKLFFEFDDYVELVDIMKKCLKKA